MGILRSLESAVLSAGSHIIDTARNVGSYVVDHAKEAAIGLGVVSTVAAPVIASAAEPQKPASPKGEVVVKDGRAYLLTKNPDGTVGKLADPPGINIYRQINTANFMTSGTYHRHFPAQSHAGLAFAYVREDDLRTTWSICVTPTSPTLERVLTTGIGNFDFNQVTFTPDNTAVVFAGTVGNETNLYRVARLTRQVTQLTNVGANKHIRDPFVVVYESTEGMPFSNNWVYTATQGFTGAGVTEITAFPMSTTGTVDIANPVSIEDLFQAGVSYATERCPKLDVNGHYLLGQFQDISGLNGDTQSRIFYVSGVKDIIKGVTTKVSSRLDPRFYQGSSSGYWNQPIALSVNGNILFYSSDLNRVFNKTTRNFTASNFEIIIEPIVGNLITLSQPGNQFSGTTALDGKDLYFTTDDNTSGTHKIKYSEIEVFMTGFTPGGIGMYRVIEHVDGTKLELFPGNTINLSSDTIRIRPLQSSQRAIFGARAYAINVFDPAGATFVRDTGTTAPTIVTRYLQRDIGATDETSLAQYIYNSVSGNFDIAIPRRRVNAILNQVEGDLQHFSTVGLKSRQQMAAEHWRLYSSISAPQYQLLVPDHQLIQPKDELVIAHRQPLVIASRQPLATPLYAVNGGFVNSLDFVALKSGLFLHYNTNAQMNSAEAERITGKKPIVFEYNPQKGQK